VIELPTRPDRYDFRVTEHNSEKWAGLIAEHLLKDLK
jgi:hypothetical protein